MFVLDESFTVSRTDFTKELEFVEGIMGLFEVGAKFTRVGVLTYGDRVDVEFNLNSYQTKDEVINAVKALDVSIQLFISYII